MNEHQQAITQWLTLLRNVCKKNNPDGVVYYGPGDLLLQHGRWYEPRPLPRGHWRGEQKACFRNALMAASRFRLKYVEGYACGIIPVHHAWCVDDENRVYEVTWPSKMCYAYFGIQFPLSRVWNGNNKYSSPVLDPVGKPTIYYEPFRS